ncbi:MAG: hypothetical protein GXP29_12790 [Planctomycetes bacterium]|nr:hypothetical protein [Planctomycetota bacterium]
MSASTWELTAAGLAVVAPLVAVPLTVMTFYLKGLREQQAGRFSDLADRVNSTSEGLRRVLDDVALMQRNYTTKEEWLRETMWARGKIESLCASVMRVEAELESHGSLAATSQRTHRLVAKIADRAGIGESVSKGCGPTETF